MTTDFHKYSERFVLKLLKSTCNGKEEARVYIFLTFYSLSELEKVGTKGSEYHFQSEVDRLSHREVFFLKNISSEISPGRTADPSSDTLRDNHFSLSSKALFRPLSIVEHSSSTYWKYIELEIQFD